MPGKVATQKRKWVHRQVRLVRCLHVDFFFFKLSLLEQILNLLNVGCTILRSIFAVTCVYRQINSTSSSQPLTLRCPCAIHLPQ